MHQAFPGNKGAFAREGSRNRSGTKSQRPTAREGDCSGHLSRPKVSRVGSLKSGNSEALLEGMVVRDLPAQACGC